MACNICGSHEAEVIWQEKSYTVVRCRRCGLIYQDPLPPKTTELYTEEYFKNNYLKYVNRRLDYLRKQWTALSALLPGKGYLADIGCGTGFFLQVAREHDWEAVGVESSSFAAAYARKNLPVKIYADIAELSGQQCSFDAVTFWDVLAHVDDPAGMVKQAVGLLKPGSLIIIKTPHWRAATFFVAHWLGRLTGKSAFFLHIPRQQYFFSPGTLSEMLEQNGLKVINQKYLSEARLGRVQYSDNFIKQAAGRLIKVFMHFINQPESFMLLARKEV